MSIQIKHLTCVIKANPILFYYYLMNLPFYMQRNYYTNIFLNFLISMFTNYNYVCDYFENIYIISFLFQWNRYACWNIYYIVYYKTSIRLIWNMTLFLYLGVYKNNPNITILFRLLMKSFETLMQWFLRFSNNLISLLMKEWFGKIYKISIHG